MKWGDDRWLSKEGSTPIRYDKLEYLLLTFIGQIFLSYLIYISPYGSAESHLVTAVFISVLGVIYELLIDGRKPWGASMKDLLANEVGIIAGVVPWI